MVGIELQYATDDSVVNALLSDVITGIEAACPGRVAGYYLVGSYADGSTVRTSDLDLVAVVQGHDPAATATCIRAVAATVAAGAPVPLDVDTVSWERLRVGQAPLEAIRLRTASVPLAGADLRASLPLPALAVYRRLVTPAPYINFVQLIRGCERVTYPLDYPDPAGAFFGYDALRPSNRYSSDGRGLKDLVNGMGWTATALVALYNGAYVAGKTAALRRYQADIGDEWTGLLADVYAFCRGRWAYLVPAAAPDRAALRAMCHRILAFENYYLACYRDYLLAELRGSDVAGWTFAIQRLGEVVYPDEDIRSAVRDRARTDDPLLHAAAASP